MDHVYNAGSRFVEQRFIVDQTAPEVMATSAGVVCGGAVPTDAIAQMPSYTFTASFVDDGVGVDLSTVSVNVSGPSGEPTVSDLSITSNGVSLKISNPAGGMLALGNYVVTISGEDKLGNEFGSVCTFVVGSNVVQVTAPKVFPNPMNPAAGNASISFELPKAAEVTVTAYDWSGDFVATIFKGQLPVGPQNIQWGGQAEDGTALANGVYLLRIVADDGARQEPKVVKVAIWNER
jgi:hypothetical protein